MNATQEYRPQHLTRWTQPDNWTGETWYDYYGAGVGQHRESDALDRANFQAACACLGAIQPNGLDDDGAGWVIVREDHWAVGWVEWIAIHHTSQPLLSEADEIVRGLEDYPVIDEALHSQIEDDYCNETWLHCFDWRERLAYLRDHSGTYNVSDALAAVRGSWYHAANMLNCPSDLLY